MRNSIARAKHRAAGWGGQWLKQAAVFAEVEKIFEEPANFFEESTRFFDKTPRFFEDPHSFVDINGSFDDERDTFFEECVGSIVRFGSVARVNSVLIAEIRRSRNVLALQVTTPMA